MGYGLIAYVVVFVISAVVSIMLAPRPESQKPAGLDEFQVPTAEAGREIPVLFGTRMIKGPNVVWYGHLRTVAIVRKGGKK